MKQVRFFFVVGLAMMLSACGAGIRYGADFMPTHDFSGYSSFQWEGADAMPTGDPRLDANPFFEQRVRAAVEEELVARGLTSSSEPDVTVHFHAAVRERLEVLEPDRTSPIDPSLSPSEVRSWEEGTLLVDVVEVASGEVVWRGWARTDVSGLLDNPEREEARIREAVILMFQRFPLPR
jgi:hypothetical protein